MVTAIVCALFLGLLSADIQTNPAPTSIRAVFPAYPPVMKATGSGGIFIVEIRVTTQGEVESASLLEEKLPSPMSDTSVFTVPLLEAVRQWRYPPSSERRCFAIRFKYDLHFEGSKRTANPGVVFTSPSEVGIWEDWPGQVLVHYLDDAPRTHRKFPSICK